jgi:hypothetical protein
MFSRLHLVSRIYPVKLSFADACYQPQAYIPIHLLRIERNGHVTEDQGLKGIHEFMSLLPYSDNDEDQALLSHV